MVNIPDFLEKYFSKQHVIWFQEKLKFVKNQFLEKLDFIKLFGWLLVLLVVPFLVITFYKTNIQVFINFCFLSVFSILYWIIIDDRVRKWVQTYGSIVTSVSLFVALGTFFLNIQINSQKEYYKLAQLTQERVQRIGTLIKEDNTKNYEALKIILTDQNNAWIFLFNFTNEHYQNNWDFVYEAFGQECFNNYATVSMNVEVGNNLITSIRFLHDSHSLVPQTQWPFVLGLIAERKKDLKSTAELMKKSLNYIMNLEKKCQ